MKKLLLFVFATLAFAACTQDVVVDITPAPIVDEAPETLVVGFEGDDTRIQLNEAQKTVWTKGDLVSVFYRSDANQKWQYRGETGERVAELMRVDAGTATTPTTAVVVVYPYDANYYLNTRTFNIQATLPAVQSYLKDSYGLGGNIMISQSEYNQFSLKSVCGWLKLQLTGNGEKISSITLRGNNGEQVAGELYINSADATALLAADMGSADDNNAGGSLIFDDTILKEVTLDCGEGVTLGAEATAFYIALPPQTFENGFTIEVECDGYRPMIISTSNSITIERNHIQPMAPKEHNATPITPNNQIWYTSTDVVEPYNIDAFGATIISNEWDSETGKGIITFDGDVTMVGNKAFYNCDNFITITLPDSVTTIGKYAFYGCTSLTSVNIPDSVTTIGDLAFYDCLSLTSVNIPDSVTTIGNQAFQYCISLTSVNIPDSVTTIGNNAFINCDSLREFTGKYAADGGRCLIIDNTIIAYAEASGTTYNIPESVTTIGNYAFYSCYSLTSVTIPDSVTTIGDCAFSDCDSLTSVNIPESVTTIGEYAFYHCTSLKYVYCKATTPPVLGNSYVFDENGSGRKIYVPAESVDAYKSATYWSEYASAIVGYDFENGEIVEVQPNNQIWYTATKKAEHFYTGKSAFGANLISNEWDSETGKGIITFDGNVTMVGYQAFNSCDNFITINLPDSVTTIGEEAFYHCDSLTSVNIPESVTTIGEDAFAFCNSLTIVTIGNSVTTIGNDAFYECYSLKYVYCKATTPPALGGSYVFEHNASGRRIIVPIGSGVAYKKANRWSRYANDIFEDEF